ncbi:hypothetical protein [Hymenobacter sp. YC55]|uniref:hypothetical protein n=1 Tax=Hymenobacter sp. YC55 TaxID=3034019 RepID=UPI0023F75F7D|nr:hypothetical protein [Hymenobacter sp. YC55]MDF7815905.1 hypothetical protein [Hymenobacter sp. YC55]
MQRPTQLLGLLFVFCCAFGPDLTWNLFQVDTQLAVHFPATPQELDVPRTMAVLRPTQQQDAMVRASQAYMVKDQFARYVLVKIPSPNNQPYRVPARTDMLTTEGDLDTTLSLPSGVRQNALGPTIHPKKKEARIYPGCSQQAKSSVCCFPLPDLLGPERAVRE